MSNIVTLMADNGLTVTGLRGKTAPLLKAGYGGWNKVDRPKRIGATQWDGRDPMQMELDLIFDGWPDDAVEQQCSTLEVMAGLKAGQKPGDKKNLPPVITSIVGDVPHGQDMNWIINDLTWGTEVIYQRGIGRVRQDVKILLWEKVDDAIVAENVHSTPGVPATYIWKKGDTLQKIAIRFYGDVNMWQTIADYNNIRDPGSIQPGTVIQLP